MAAVAEVVAAAGAGPPAPGLIDWTAARLGAWLFEKQGLCIAAAALAFAAFAVLAWRDLRRLRRIMLSEARLRTLLALAGCEAIALRVRAARRDGAPASAGPDPAGPEPGRTQPGRTQPGDWAGAVFPLPIDPDAGRPDPRDADRDSWEVDRGAGRTAAGLIMTAPSLDDARAIFDGHSAAPRRTDPAWAAWAMLWRLEMAGEPEAARALAAAFGAAELLAIDAADADALERLHFGAMDRQEDIGQEGIGRDAMGREAAGRRDHGPG